jgi:ParB/RepB/Spo0J family partition protein
MRKHLRIEFIALDRLDPRKRNPNRMSASGYAALVESIRTRGFLQPILVRPIYAPADGFEIVDGAHRWRAAGEVGFDDVPCVVLEEGDNAEEIAAALQIGMNRLRGELDLTEVGEVLAELAKKGWGPEELAITGFDSSEIDELIASVSGEDTRSILAGSDAELPGEDEKPDEAPAVFTIEIELPSRADLVRAKRALRAAGSGDMGRGLLALLGDAP